MFGTSGGKESRGDSEKVPFFKLIFSLAAGLDMALMMAGAAGALGNGLSQPLMTVIFGQLINSIGEPLLPKSILHEMAKVSMRFVYLGIFAGFSALLQISCWMIAGERQATRLRILYLKTILRQDIGFFDTETSKGEVVGKMSGDTILIQEAIGEKVGKFLQFASASMGGFIIAFVKGWQLALVLIACLPFFFLPGGCMSLFTSKMSGRMQVAYAEASNVLEQTVGGIREVASFTGEKLAIQKYNNKLQKAYRITANEGLVLGLGSGSFSLILFSIYGFAIWYGSKLIIEKGYRTGDVVNIMVSITIGGMSLGQIAPCVTAIVAGQVVAFKMFETMKRIPQIDAYKTSGIILEDMKGEIELKDVYFGYPSRPEVQIFAGFSLHVPSGTTSALVGHSGSGKSTVISLLERFYDPDAGELLIDGVNLKEIRLGWFREKVGLVNQEPVLFATTIKENILYGKASASESELRSAIFLANASNFIENLPQRLDTMVGEQGTQLSGGQKQRIAIARAIIKNPKILLLDEATSALDVESERIIQNALGIVMSNRTTVIVAHRLTTIRNADIIAVLQNGKIVEKGAKLIQRVRSLSFEKIVHQEISWFDAHKNSSGALGARLSIDASTLRSLVGDALALLVQNIATVMTGVIMSLTINWKLAFIILVPIPLIILEEFIQFKLIKGFSEDVKVMHEEGSQVASEAVGSIRTIASFFAEEKVTEMYERKCQAPIKQVVKIGILRGAGLGFCNLALNCSNAFCFYTGALLVIHGQATFGEAYKVFFSLMFSAIGVYQTMVLAPDFNKVKDSVVSIFQILDSKQKIDSRSNKGQTPTTVKGDIVLQNISFKYPTRPDIQIFQDLCLTIPSGKTVALVGESGSGKSTIIRLIERFYDPDSGHIYLDGHELRTLKITWLRQQIGLVSQEPILFNETIRSNIEYGKQGNVNEDEIIAAAKISNAHDFISALPNGYDTCVGERGIQLSGGQKQRIAIARSIIKDPRILLLDEATSALDAASERRVQDALDKAKVNRTTVVVAHRLSTIRGADVIAVMKNNGVIVEKGRHEELMNIENGVYASLVALQSNPA